MIKPLMQDLTGRDIYHRVDSNNGIQTNRRDVLAIVLDRTAKKTLDELELFLLCLVTVDEK